MVLCSGTDVRPSIRWTLEACIGSQWYYILKIFLRMVRIVRQTSNLLHIENSSEAKTLYDIHFDMLLPMCKRSAQLLKSMSTVPSLYCDVRYILNFKSASMNRTRANVLKKYWSYVIASPAEFWQVIPAFFYVFQHINMGLATAKS